MTTFEFLRQLSTIKSGKKFHQKYCSSDHAIQTLTNTGDLVEHGGCVNAINFNPSGDLIVTGSDDTTVKIWNMHTRKSLVTL